MSPFEKGLVISWFLGGCVQVITKTETEILSLIKKGYTTPKQIATSRGTTTQAVYNILKSLYKKGYLIKGRLTPKKNLCTPNSLKHKIRLHAQQFNIKLIYQDYKYFRILKKSNILTIDDNTIRLHKKSINVYSHTFFMADTVEKAIEQSLEYWQKFFIRLENDLKVIIVKSRYQNIKLVKAHYSEMDNEFAKEKRLSGEKFQIRCKDSGKLWLIIDNSFNLDELEFIHPETGEQDATKLKGFIDDIRDNEITTVTDLKNIMGSMAKTTLNNSKQIESILILLKGSLEKIIPTEPDNINKLDDSPADYIG